MSYDRTIKKTDGTLLLSEPKGHVTSQQFSETESVAQSLGLEIIGIPHIRGQYSALLGKPSNS